MWASMVSLAQAVQRAVVETNGGTPEALEASHDLELVLQRHRNTFISLLRNPPKNTNERCCFFFICIDKLFCTKGVPSNKI
ncbi:hypothetical protein E2C01_064313 [Portunus trituberculatus]|uniref:Uncharacterized protein n=1 Tax=Portunus trituberculatus TaxID=210409 RepID=A0A5B7HLF8_PORTR|nr:hypothetical protein [Portunus trituberculatus]